MVQQNVFTERDIRDLLSYVGVYNIWNTELTSGRIYKSSDEELIRFIKEKLEIFNIKGIGEVSFIEHTKGGKYLPHVDNNGLEGHYMTFIILLSNPLDYDGGDLRFLNIPKSKEFNEQGYIHIFPSFFAWEITKIKKGKKQIISAFAHGEEWK